MMFPLKLTRSFFTVLFISKVISENQTENVQHSNSLYPYIPYSTYALISYPLLLNLLSGRFSFVSQQNSSRLEGKIIYCLFCLKFTFIICNMPTKCNVTIKNQEIFESLKL